MDFGSNVLWVSLFEGGNFDEWTSMGGNAAAYPSPANTITVSTAYAHHGRYAAELAIDAGPDGTQQNTGLRPDQRAAHRGVLQRVVLPAADDQRRDVLAPVQVPPANRRGRSGER